MRLEELKEACQNGASLCLGHANMGAYSCFEIATEAIDDSGEGFCKDHAAFAKEIAPNGMICYRCRKLVWDENGTGTWGPPDENCIRCWGTGIDPVCWGE